MLRFPLFPIDERFPDNFLTYFHESISDISKGARRGFRRGVIYLRIGLPLHKKVSSLRSRRGIGTQYGYLSEKGLSVADEYKPLQSPRISVGEMFGTIFKLKVLVEQWLREYNHMRPYNSLGYRPPAPEVIIAMGA